MAAEAFYRSREDFVCDGDCEGDCSGKRRGKDRTIKWYKAWDLVWRRKLRRSDRLKTGCRVVSNIPGRMSENK